MSCILDHADFEQVLAEATCVTGEQGGSYCELPEGVRGPDDTLGNNSVAALQMLAAFTKTSGSPFFLGVGFHKVGAQSAHTFPLLCLSSVSARSRLSSS